MELLRVNWARQLERDAEGAWRAKILTSHLKYLRPFLHCSFTCHCHSFYDHRAITLNFTAKVLCNRVRFHVIEAKQDRSVEKQIQSLKLNMMIGKGKEAKLKTSFFHIKMTNQTTYIDSVGFS